MQARKNTHTLPRHCEEFMRVTHGGAIEFGTVIGRRVIRNTEGKVVSWSARILSGFSTMEEVSNADSWEPQQWHSTLDERRVREETEREAAALAVSAAKAAKVPKAEEKDPLAEVRS